MMTNYDHLLVLFLLQHFQREIVRGVEGYIVTGSKQVEIGEFAQLTVILVCSLNCVAMACLTL